MYPLFHKWRQAISAVVTRPSLLPPYLEVFLLGCVLGLVFFPIPGIVCVLPFVISRFLFLIDARPWGGIATFFFLWLFFWGYFLVGLYWIYNALLVELDAFYWLIPFCFLGVPAWTALFVAAGVHFALSFDTFFPRSSQKRTHNFPFLERMDRWRAQGLTQFFLFTIAWSGAENLLQSVAGFPWALLGYVWIPHLPMAQWSAIMGPMGLTGLALLLGGIPYLLFSRRPGLPAFKTVAGIGVLLVGIYGWGWWRLATHPTLYTQDTIQIVQPNIPQTSKWNAIDQRAILNTFLQLSRVDSFQGPTIIVWPESALSYYLDEEPVLREKIGASFGLGHVLITGVLRRQPNGQIFNSIMAMEGTGVITAIYDKHHLVPFGEYLPFRRVLDPFFSTPLRKVTLGMEDFSRGPGPQILKIPRVPNCCPIVCYESIFSDEVCPRTPEPRAWIVNVTNDAWFGHSIGPYQHFQIARMRAIEEGLPLVRAANSGISAIIDPYGRVLQSLGIDKRGVLIGRLPAPGADTGFHRVRAFLRWLL